MNERIKELAEQCYHRYSDNIDLEKFAELIVRDVLNEVLQAMDDGQDVYYTVADKFRS
jgi:hypothetical protein